MKVIYIRLDDWQHQLVSDSAKKEGSSLNNYCIEKLLGGNTETHVENKRKVETVEYDENGFPVEIEKCEICGKNLEVRYFMGEDGEWHTSCLLCYLVRNPKMSKLWEKALKKPNL